MADHEAFLDAASRVVQTRRVTTGDAQAIDDHAGWMRKFIDDKKTASASRKSFGAKRKPDNEVSADALRKRAQRDKAKPFVPDVREVPRLPLAQDAAKELIAFLQPIAEGA